MESGWASPRASRKRFRRSRSRSEVATATPQLGITRQVPRNYLYVSWRAARDAPAHARTRRTHSRCSIAHAARCDAAACFARRKAEPAQTKITLHPFEGPNFPFPLRGTVLPSPLPSRSFPFEGFPSFSPFEGPYYGVPSLRGVSPSRASLPIPPSRDRTTESPPFEEFPLRGLPFLFPLRGTVLRSPLPSRSFPFEGFPDRVRPPHSATNLEWT